MSTRPVRSVANVLARVTTTATAFIVLSLLVWVMATLAWRAGTSLHTVLSGPGLGLPALGQAVVGSAMVIGLAFLMAAPLGLLAGIYLTEARERNLLSRFVRFVSGVLTGMPSVIVGIVVYFIFDRFGVTRGWLGGAIALAAMMLPMMACTTSSTLDKVSPALREAAFALGVPPWRTLLQILLRAAAPGIASAALLCVARVAVQVAPVLLVVPPASQVGSPLEASPTLHVEAYRNLLSSAPEAQAYAWTAALVLSLFSIVLVVTARRFHPEGA